jgi:hypothetical protein
VINCNNLFRELIPLLIGDLLPNSQEPLTEPYLCQPNSVNTLASSTVDCNNILASKSTTSTLFFFPQAFQSKFPYTSFDHINHQKNESSTPLSARQISEHGRTSFKTENLKLFTRCLYINGLEVVMLSYPQRRYFLPMSDDWSVNK